MARSGTEAWTAAARRAAARAVAQARAAEAEETALGRLVVALSSASTPEEAAAGALGALPALFGGCRAALFLREEPDQLVLAAGGPRRLGGPGGPGVPGSVVAGCGPFLAGLARRPAPRRLSTGTTEPAVGDLARTAELVDGWLVPLVSGGQGRGVLVLGELGDPPLGEAPEELARWLAGVGAVVALGLERAGLAGRLAERRAVDQATGVASRRAFEVEGRALAAEVARGEARAALFWLTPAPAAGPLDERAVVEAAGRLRGGVRGGDVVGRLGEWTLGVLARAVGNPEQAAALASRLGTVLGAGPRAGGSAGGPVAWRVGWALLAPGRTFEEALAQAAEAAQGPSGNLLRAGRGAGSEQEARAGWT